ncbi:MAG: PSD1 and planctomycete cytochrome C domain-containing protein [Planctomycetaceae bacterium]|nr:PSD1 and planctomycete cytochrome C domain-containing protein [Planctomycetaceae bacterium]
MPRLASAILIAIFIAFLSSLGQADEPKPEFDPAHAEKMQEGLGLFKSQVRQVLVDNCVECHGGSEVESGFDLATRKGLLRGGAHGPSVVVGKSADSNVVRFISHKEKPFMPDGADKLPAEQIAAIANWIDLGAPYDKPLVDNPRDPDAWTLAVVPDKAREFWSFQPLAAVEPPAVKNEAWVRNPIDRFVLAKLEEKGLTPSPAAERRVLIRRAYFDLIGLPPEAEVIQAALDSTPSLHPSVPPSLRPDGETERQSDRETEAYAAVIDKLLDSAHFGERWARHWLDAARFAESHGFEQDYDRPHAYHFRDFVIKAFNQDMPYDQFVRWQLAGDELAPEEPLALMATGFLGAGVFPTQITANEVERTRYDALDDMAATTGSAMLGLSIGCARCHDHKFDPIPQADYYRFLSTFTTTVRSNLDVNMDLAGYRAAKGKFDAEHAPFVAAREQFERDELPARFAAWEETPEAAAVKGNPWRFLSVGEAKSKGGATLTRQDDRSVLASGTNAEFDTYTIEASLPPGKYTGIRLEALADPTLAKGGPGRAENGNFALTDFTVALKAKQGPNKPLALGNPQATFEQTPQGLLVKNAIDGDKKSGWAVDPQFGKDHAAVFELAEELTVDEPATLVFTLDFQNNKQHSLGRPRFSVTSAARPLPLEAGGMSPEVALALSMPPGERKPEQIAAAHKFFRPFDAEWRKLNDAELEHAKSEPQPNLVKVMVCSEGVTPIRHHTQGADFFEQTFFLKRGDCDQKMGEAPQGFLQVLMTAPLREKHWQAAPPAGSKLSYRRTSLANWMTDTEHGAGHLLARVIVNRLWHHHFGRGIVATPNDFGVQGTRPTHPELLDWLARELIRNGWKLKPIHKLMMTSATYQQGSGFRVQGSERLQLNPEPRTLNPSTADPDNILLWRREPQRLEAELIRDNMLAASGTLDRTQFGPGTLDEGHTRRSIYFMVKRSKLVPMMQLFDQPEPLVSVGGRPSTTIAPQALAILNSPHIRGYAQNFAQRLLPAYERSPAEAVKQGYLAAIGRLPDEVESASTVQFLAAQEQSYAAAGKADAKKLALADFCQVLFGLNEFVYVE